MGYVFDSIFVFSFFMFFICSIVFMQLLPTNAYVWNNLTTSPPQWPSNPGWNITEYFSYGWNLFAWILTKVSVLVLFFFNLLIIPFSLMAAWPYLAPIFIPLVAIFLYGLFDKILPWMLDAIDYISNLIMGILTAIGGIIP